MNELQTAMRVASAGLSAQSSRMQIIAENLANAESTADRAGALPYRRRIPTFRQKLDPESGAQVVTLGPIRFDRSAFRLRHEPDHPAADANGMVKYPNVNMLMESIDLRNAQRAYEANLNVVTSSRAMILRTLQILQA